MKSTRVFGDGRLFRVSNEFIEGISKPHHAKASRRVDNSRGRFAASMG